MNSFFKNIQTWLVAKTSWFYILSVGTILFLCLFLMLSRLGDIRLGPDDSRPEHSNLSWFAMLFSAGMGIGLLFFGVAEPVMHYSAPPNGEALSIFAAKESMKITFFHWGLHAWAVYALLAVTLAYFCFRKNLPLLPRSAFYPIMGNKIFSIWGDLIDTFAVFGTMFGVATSLGFGVAQVNAGLNYLFAIPQTTGTQIVLIAIITLFATASVVLGLEGGIKKLSNLNIGLAVCLLLAVLLLGNTTELLQAYVQNTGAYLSDIIYKTFNMYAYEKKDSWIGGWTLLYWGWWVSWAPFVGMFIAKISKGRSIREFMLGVLFIPTGFTFLWMTVFGNTAIQQIGSDLKNDLLLSVNSNVAVALFKFLEVFPFSSFFAVLATLLVITFFVSSSDSGSLVIDTLTSGGAEEPPVWQRVFWALTEGLVASVLLLAGGLEALQTMTIAAAFPMLFLILIGAYALIRSLQKDHELLNSIKTYQTSLQYAVAGSPWKDRLDSILSLPSQKNAVNYLEEEVKPAVLEFSQELEKRDYKVVTSTDNEKLVKLSIIKPEAEDFVYMVQLKNYDTPDYIPENKENYIRAEVYLASGGQNYDIYGYKKDEILADIITQYEKHLHYMHKIDG